MYRLILLLSAFVLLAWANPESYCSSNNLKNGFHVINPLNIQDKSFEIFCYEKRDYIALPNKNEFNNFVFNKKSFSEKDYYTLAQTQSYSFDAIEINANTMEVVINNKTDTPINIGNKFKAMGKTFSSINLIGTPFAIDWGSKKTVIKECIETKLRKGYFGQTVKINTLDYNKQAICKIESMKIKLLDDYFYLTYNEEEVLENSCKLMAEKVPSNILEDKDIKGHYWIKPNKNNRNHQQNDITKAQERPIVAYCWYQPDLHWTWTFLLAMDGKRTIKKDDLTTRKDTCSELGLFPFVPNREDTFERVRNFLKSNKNEWKNYTGSIQEKVNALHGNNYYLSGEREELIWPYGSFGVYYPSNGGSWGNAATNKPGYMSGSPMHNISEITTDYERYNNFYRYGNYSSTDNITSPEKYEYKDTMGSKGWVSILGKDDLGITDEWFISRTGAGDNLTGNQAAYFEPNGNYTKGCWLNFLFDDEGRIRHNDDWDCNYPYYDYMCMSIDNYDLTKRYTVTRGIIDVVERSVPLGAEAEAKNRTITTKIVKKPIELDVILLDENNESIVKNQNLSVGIFLSTIEEEDNVEVLKELKYIGDAKDLGISQGRFELPLNEIDEAYKNLFFRFKFCDGDARIYSKWTDCWASGLNGKESVKNVASFSESDQFAARPDKFELIFDVNQKIAGRNYEATIKALDNNGANTKNYNEQIPFSFKEVNPICLEGSFLPDINNISFLDGIVTISDLSYSEVGNIKVAIKEILGSEFAKIDMGDTSETNRLITPYEHNIAFVPSYFDMNSTLTQPGGSYVYLNSFDEIDSNMTAKFDIEILPKNDTGDVVNNYTKSCYAKETDLTFAFENINISPSNSIEKMIFSEETSNIKGEIDVSGNNLTISSITNSIFQDGNIGANLKLRVNFDRKADTPVEPFRLISKSFQLEDEDSVSGLLTINDHNATFYYGRVHSPDYRGTSPITAKVGYEVYCKNCDKTTHSISNKQSPTTPFWFINTKHDKLEHGKVKSVASQSSKTTSNPAVSININNGIEDLTLTTNTVPSKDKIILEPDSWLIYNTFNPNTNFTDFLVEFTTGGEWAGEGSVNKESEGEKEGEHVGKNDNNNRTNRRISW